MPIRVALVDDHAIVVEGLRLILQKEEDMEVVGTGICGEDAVRLARDLKPHVLLLDIIMPGLNGIDAARRIARGVPEVGILALSMVCERPQIVTVLRAGAKGYIIKDEATEELVKGVRAVAAGERYLSPKVTHLIVHDYLCHVPLDHTGTFAGLTLREQAILKLVADGLSTKEIAFRVGVSLKTVDSQRQSLMKKLNLHSTAELTKYAVRKGLSPLGWDSPGLSEI